METREAAGDLANRQFVNIPCRDKIALARAGAVFPPKPRPVVVITFNVPPVTEGVPIVTVRPLPPIDDKQLPADWVIDYVRCWQRKDLASDLDGYKVDPAEKP